MRAHLNDPRTALLRVAVVPMLLLGRYEHRLAERRERGQATAEYALLLLGAAAVALLVVAWATKTGKIGTLLNKVFDAVTNKVA